MPDNQVSSRTISALNNSGDRVFLNPRPTHCYNYLVKHSLAPNTYRGFHKINKNKPGAGETFRKALSEMSDKILSDLKSAKSAEDIDILTRTICRRVRARLKGNIVNSQLDSFNKIRKPIDIFIEHLVSMDEELSNHRVRLTEYLFLPLDSEMFRSKTVFADKDLKELGIRRAFTFKDIVEKEKYYRIQEYLSRRARSLGIKSRIYFDMLWNNRYTTRGTNLFKTNP